MSDQDKGKPGLLGKIRFLSRLFTKKKSDNKILTRSKESDNAPNAGMFSKKESGKKATLSFSKGNRKDHTWAALLGLACESFSDTPPIEMEQLRTILLKKTSEINHKKIQIKPESARQLFLIEKLLEEAVQIDMSDGFVNLHIPDGPVSGAVLPLCELLAAESQGSDKLIEKIRRLSPLHRQTQQPF